MTRLPPDVARAYWSFIYFQLGIIVGMWLPPIIVNALAAETLPAVSPPTDWTGVAIVAGIAVLAVAIVGYIVHIKRTPGAQFGEEQIESIVERLYQKQNPPAVTFTLPTPLVLDGITFPDQAKLDEYRLAKAVLAAYANPKGDAP